LPKAKSEQPTAKGEVLAFSRLPKANSQSPKAKGEVLAFSR